MTAAYVPGGLVRYRARWRGEGRGQAWRKWLALDVWELRRNGVACRFAENHRTEARSPKGSAVAGKIAAAVNAKISSGKGGAE